MSVHDASKIENYIKEQSVMWKQIDIFEHSLLTSVSHDQQSEKRGIQARETEGRESSNIGRAISPRCN